MSYQTTLAAFSPAARSRTTLSAGLRMCSTSTERASNAALLITEQAFSLGLGEERQFEFDAVFGHWRESLRIASRQFVVHRLRAEVWRRGSVIGSWLLDLTAMALAEDPKLDRYSGFVEDSGEGRWTIMAVIEEAVPAEVLSAALYCRFRSREQASFSDLSVMRNKFGGHVEPKIAPQADT